MTDASFHSPACEQADPSGHRIGGTTVPKKGSQSEWTDWHISEMRRRAANGESAEQVATCINFSRAAVLGKAHRLGIHFDSRGNEELRKTNRELRAKGLPVPKKEQPRAARERRVKIAAAVVMVVPVPIEAPQTVPHVSPLVTIMDLKEGVCRFPIGDPHDDNFGYCGAHAPDGSPYCCEHRLICYTRKASPKLPRSFKLQFLGTMLHETAE